MTGTRTAFCPICRDFQGGEDVRRVMLSTRFDLLLESELNYNKLTPWSIFLLEKLTVAQPVKRFPAFYGILRHITVVTTCHLTLFWARCIQSTSSLSVYLKSFLILSSHLRLCLPSGFFASDYPTKIPLPCDRETVRNILAQRCYSDHLIKEVQKVCQKRESLEIWKDIYIYIAI